jgi:hypothetical protein
MGYHSRGTQQISQGKTLRLRGHPVTTTHTATGGIRTSSLGADWSAMYALRCFAFARNGRAPMTSTRPPLAGPSAHRPPTASWCSSSTPLSLRCRVPSVRAPGLDFHLLSEPSCLAHRPFGVPSEPSWGRAVARTLLNPELGAGCRSRARSKGNARRCRPQRSRYGCEPRG